MGKGKAQPDVLVARTAKPCDRERRIGAQTFRCRRAAGHSGIHMSPGDSGDSIASRDLYGPYLVTWPGLPGVQQAGSADG